MLFNEPKLLKFTAATEAATAGVRFSALQRAEIAEIDLRPRRPLLCANVSVLFNEPKLLKWRISLSVGCAVRSFSALQRAEIAEIQREREGVNEQRLAFQCSSTSRNC